MHSGHDGQLLQSRAGKKELVHQLLSAKEDSGKSFTEIGRELGLTNMYTAQLFHNQVGADAVRRVTLVKPHPSSGRGPLAATGNCGIGSEVSVKSPCRKTQWEPDVHSELCDEFKSGHLYTKNKASIEQNRLVNLPAEDPQIVADHQGEGCGRI